MTGMRARACAVVLLASVLSGCGGPAVDLTKFLQIEVVDSGWYDVGIVNGQNKLVPQIVVRLKNSSDQKLPVLQLNALFRQVTSDTEEWGSSFQTVAGSDGLAPGATTQPLTVRSQNGYTGSDQSRQEMLKNSRFVDAKVDMFAKYGSVQWVKMGQFAITRALVEQKRGD
jgi:hypothetical protein